MAIGVKVDWLLTCPFWPNVRKPFVALHISHYGHAMPGSRPIYDVLLMWGRQFMPLPGNGGSRMKSWHFIMPWSDRA